MEFFGREEELSQLAHIREQSLKKSTFTVITGRRRIGKTELMLRSVQGQRYIYLFVSRVNETLLCSELVKASMDAGVELPGNYTRLAEVLKALMIYTRAEPLTLLIDEFQDLKRVNKSIFSEIQNVWDSYKGTTKMNLVISGSVHSMMKEIFENDKEPLFQRPTSKIELHPFSISLMKGILRRYNSSYTNGDLLTMYMLTGGVPLYIELLMDDGATDSESMLRKVSSSGSVFLTDGKDILVTEFGTEYSTYFSILQLLSEGKGRRAEVEQELNMEVGPYLKRLEDEYGFVDHISPIFSDPSNRNTRWVVSDMYMRFYFRFIQPNYSYVESGRYDLLRRMIDHGISEYEGRALEDYFRRKLTEEETYTQIGSYWNRSGTVEIDIVLIDDIEKKARLIEVKRNPDKIRLGELREKGKQLSHKLEGYEVSFEGFSMEDM